MAIHFRADQVVSGLALTFLGTGLARVLGEGLSKAGAIATAAALHRPDCSRASRSSGRSCSGPERLAYVGFLLVPLAWYWIDRTRPGLHLRAVGERPAAADALGIDV